MCRRSNRPHYLSFPIICLGKNVGDMKLQFSQRQPQRRLWVLKILFLLLNFAKLGFYFQVLYFWKKIFRWAKIRGREAIARRVPPPATTPLGALH